MEHRIEEFTKEGKNFIYLDLSEFKTNEEYREFVETANKHISKHAQNSLYTITNVKDVSFDTETKSIIADWMDSNEPYVKYGAVIGFDGVKRIVVNAIFKLSDRKNMSFVPNKEQAIEWLLKQEQ
ncbi:MAG: hypothetical protein LBH25_04255 [Fibromonadaceae bacterium]|jgi:hypothetical protein|nr:hypothetical protein [Fibromonadaceae bacterium]